MKYDVHSAAERIAPYAHRTPVVVSQQLDSLLGKNLFFKCELFQKTGAFKFRGAMNSVAAFDNQSVFVTHSSGNHGAALAKACLLMNKKAHIVFPESGNPFKKKAMLRYGAQLHYCKATAEARESMAGEIEQQYGCQLVHPSDEPLVISGQGTATLELCDKINDLDAIVVPVGGGGIIAGACLAAPDKIKIYGAEPAAAADAKESLKIGDVVRLTDTPTVCDGLKSSLGPNTLSIMQKRLDSIIEVTDPETCWWMLKAWEVLKLTIEPNAAIALAVAAQVPEKRVGVMLTGGNVDVSQIGQYATLASQFKGHSAFA